MTYKEKLIAGHPELNEEEIRVAMLEGCPTHYWADVSEPDNCKGIAGVDCMKCWEREVSVAEPQSRIKDSGDRTEFATGAVRDMHGGKGRCDLMPLEVVFRCYDMYARDKGERERDEADVIKHIKNFTYTADTEHLLRALDAFPGFDSSWSTMFLEVAKHFEEGAKKYGESNWRKGIPMNCYIDSAVRHYLKWLRGDNDEPHDRAFVWNVMCCIWEVDYGEEYRRNNTIT